jgi:hypothetical protein
MATKLPRLNVVLEPAVYKTIHRLSKKQGLSMSLVARDLLREALKIHEDIYWAKEAAAREKTFVREKALRHDQIWKS